MTKQEETNRENILKEFSEKVAEWISINALVNDNWVNTLKTYHNIEITGDETLRICMLMKCMYIELVLARFEDLLEPREKTAFEKAVIEHIAYFDSMFSTTVGDGKRDEVKKKAENIVYGLLELYRRNRQEQNLTIPQNYLAYLANPSHGTKLSEEMWNEYITNHIKEFEDKNFRIQLMKSLDKNRFL